MSFEFPYRFLKFEDGGEVPYPIIIAKLNTTLGKQSYSFILDTGADITTLPHYMISLLGMDKKKLEKSESTGIGGKTQTFNGKTDIIIGKLTFSIPVVFVMNNAIPFLLGKEGIFDRFNIVLDNDRNRTVLHVR
ncbi:MAG: aspartyl protease family protein [Candidatus Roizmanbacteria bacterium]|nr:aspartyl protease family protein [Candidatus Roizmanbacteria bacterium]